VIDFWIQISGSKTDWANEGFIEFNRKAVSYDLLDELQLPDILLPLRPSGLTSLQTYKIIRKHVQDNINPKAAIITSDYNFCLQFKED